MGPHDGAAAGLSRGEGLRGDRRAMSQSFALSGSITQCRIYLYPLPDLPPDWWAATWGRDHCSNPRGVRSRPEGWTGLLGKAGLRAPRAK